MTEDESEHLSRLYPLVDNRATPLPRSWSTRDKCTFIGLSQRNLRVHYKGAGKNHRDAAAVRTSHPIPAACGLYYFEITVVSKGRDGYVGIGLSAQSVNMGRLPGWDKNSFGYHADDGHSFCSSGNGQPYGPTFTTGDTVGCCLNLINHTCFFTKNGVNLGTVFTDLPQNLYPTVGLQTPGEVIDTNFGESPFVFDFQGLIQEYRTRMQSVIERFPVADSEGSFQSTLHKVVSGYLVHHGYHESAETFAQSTGQTLEEEFSSIRSRKKIQRLILDGQISHAIKLTKQLHPGLLEQNANLLFTLRCRQFIEMVAGTDTGSLDSDDDIIIALSPTSARQPTPESEAMDMSGVGVGTHVERHVFADTARYPFHRSPGRQASSHHGKTSPLQRSGSRDKVQKSPSHSPTEISPNLDPSHNNLTVGLPTNGGSHSNGMGVVVENGSDDDDDIIDGMITNGSTVDVIERAEGNETMEVEEVGDRIVESVNETSSSRVVCPVPAMTRTVSVRRMEKVVDDKSLDMRLCGGNRPALERLLQFGHELQLFNSELRKEHGANPSNDKLLQEAFSLLAYSDPWSSPIASLLDPMQREPVCDALNGAILESHQLSKQSPLELAVQHTRQCLRLMSKSGIGSCAFVAVDDFA